VTGLGEAKLRPLGNCFVLDSFLKIAEEAKIFGLLFFFHKLIWSPCLEVGFPQVFHTCSKYYTCIYVCGYEILYLTQKMYINTFSSFIPEVDVMITIFCHFANFCAKFLAKIIQKIITSAPE
jgi:hypothetical protein